MHSLTIYRNRQYLTPDLKALNSDGSYMLSRHLDIILFDKGCLFPRLVAPEAVIKGVRGVSERKIAAITKDRRLK